VFFKAEDPAKLYARYERHLGIGREPTGAVTFTWRDGETNGRPGATVWALLAVLAEEGVPIDPDREEYDYGKFAWITDPEGNRIELWEPKGT
jgi:hypothetical protein